MGSQIDTAYPDTGLASLPDFDFEISLTPPTQAPIFRSAATDVRFVGLTSRRGRSDALNQTNPGKFGLTLNGRLRWYDPDYPAGPFAEHIKPNRRNRLLARIYGVTYIIWDAYTDRWQQSYPGQGKDVITQVSATDGFKRLAKARIKTSPYTDAVLADSPNVYYKFDDSGAPTIVHDSGPRADDGTYTGTPAFEVGLIAAGDLSAALVSDGTLTVGGEHTIVPSGGDWAVEFWINTTTATQVIGQWKNSSSAGQMFMAGGKLRASHNGGAGFYWQNTNALNDGADHHVVFRYTGATGSWVIDGATDAGTSVGTGAGTFSSLSDGELRLLLSDPTDSFFGFGPPGIFIGTFDEFALYSPALSVVRAQAHYSAGVVPFEGQLSGARVASILDGAGWANADRDIDTGDATLQAADTWNGEFALERLQSLWETERGMLYMGLDAAMSSDHTFKLVWRAGSANTTATRSTVSQVTFDPAAGLKYADVETDPSGDTFLYNDITLQRRGGQPQHVFDQQSIDDYDPSSFSRTDLDFDNDVDVLALANTLLARYKDPRTRILALVITPQSDPTNLWPQVLGREIGDLITVVIPAPGGVGSAITHIALIVGVEHALDAKGKWTTTWRLSEVDTL